MFSQKERPDPNVFNVHADHLGSPRKITNQAGSTVWQWQDKPFGDAPVNQDPDGNGIAFEYNLRFPGQYFDAETGLHYNYHRYYDPQTGRYITSDPIGLAGGLNTYGYVGGNPVNFIDPMGLDREVIFWSPLPRPASVFGHVSSRGGNGENYSYGHEGWDRTYTTADKYIQRQTANNNRVGVGAVVELTPEQDAKYDRCMKSAKNNDNGYNAFINNCGTAAQACLSNVGIPIIPSILPGSFQQELFNSGSVQTINWYGSPK